MNNLLFIEDSPQTFNQCICEIKNCMVIKIQYHYPIDQLLFIRFNNPDFNKLPSRSKYLKGAGEFIIGIN